MYAAGELILHVCDAAFAWRMHTASDCMPQWRVGCTVHMQWLSLREEAAASICQRPVQVYLFDEIMHASLPFSPSIPWYCDLVAVALLSEEIFTLLPVPA